MTSTADANIIWTQACPYEQLLQGCGVGVLLDDGSQAALFRAPDDQLYAINNIDPFSLAPVMSRGILGDRAGRLVVQAPIRKQAFALDDGLCLDDTNCTIRTYRTRIRHDGMVEIGRT